ncbi:MULTISPECIES: ABC transporter permease [unclassified Pigmentiphaga]|uniref:ABC transporter permease n=1 Tax=Pigmentiphaga TaxID=152267 RepID=UPI000B41B130|nr:nodulation protein NodJ [Pigmentiphaga sp. NML030171]
MSEWAVDTSRSGVWGLPRPGRGCVPVLRRNFLVWRKTALTTVLGDVMDPMVALLALGYGLGSLLPGIDGVPYVTFLAAGSICMGALYAATFEATYSAFSRLHIQRTWDAMLNTPLSLDDVVFAEILWAAAKSMKSGLAILLVVVALDISRAATLLWIPPALVLLGVTFAALALVMSALAKGFDFFMYYFTLGVTPMVFLSGVFFPVSQLPEALVQAARLLPLAPAIELVRPLVLGRMPDQPWLPVLQLALTAAVAIWLATALMRRRLLR